MMRLCRVAVPGIMLTLASCSGAGVGHPGLDVPTWTVTGPEVRIGSVDDPAYAFGSVQALAVGPNGFLYSLHRNEPSVRVWTPDGQPADSIGREGEGPGEFKRPWILGFFGDTLWVTDLGTYRASYFRPDGTFLGIAAPKVDLGSATTESTPPPRPMRPLRDGTWYGVTPAFSDGIARGTLTEVPHVHMDAGGHVLNTIWVQHYRTTDILAILNKDGRGGTYGPQPFGDAPLTGALDDGSLVVADARVPTSAQGARFFVTKIDASGDTLWRDTIAYAPTPLPASRVDSAIAARTESMYGFMSRIRPGTSHGDVESDIRAAMYAPPFLPYLEGLLVTTDGSIWLRRTQSPRDGESWLVLDPDGKPSAEILTPTDLRVLLVHGDDVWGVEIDSLDVNYIVRYRLDRGGA